MKAILLSFFTIVSIISPLSAQTLNEDFDQNLAEEYGADDYGMKNYVFAILKTGSNKIENKDTLNSLFKGHMTNMQRLVSEGQLIVTGPFGKNELSYRGLYIINVKTIEEAQDLCNTDPAIKAGLLEVELIPRYGSAALSEYIKVSAKINKYKM